jgi:hypothetical protein
VFVDTAFELEHCRTASCDPIFLVGQEDLKYLKFIGEWYREYWATQKMHTIGWTVLHLGEQPLVTNKI